MAWLLLCIGWATSAAAQPARSAPGVFLNGGYSFLPFENNSQPVVYYQHIVRAGGGVFLRPRWALLGAYQQVFSISHGEPQPATYFAGLSGQYHYIRADSWSFFAEVGLNYGNHCTCEGSGRYPYRGQGMLYRSIGGGFQHRIWSGLWGEFGYLTHNMVLRQPDSYGHNYFYLALQARLQAFGQGK
ncbi:MAG: hypothetical protein OHK0039_47460 [Bacteroidia bacterium]